MSKRSSSGGVPRGAPRGPPRGCQEGHQEGCQGGNPEDHRVDRRAQVAEGHGNRAWACCLWTSPPNAAKLQALNAKNAGRGGSAGKQAPAGESKKIAKLTKELNDAKSKLKEKKGP